MHPIRQYNGIMFAIGREENTIGTSLSESTDGWNLRDMVSEVQYTLDLWCNPTGIPWADAHDKSQPEGRPWYRNWYNEKLRMVRFIDKYKEQALKMKCVSKHCSKYD